MRFQSLRYELSHPRTSVQLCLLGIVGGCSAAALIILFRLCVENLQLFSRQLMAELSDDQIYQWLLLPIVSASLILLIAFLTGFKHYRLGIPFVIHRVKYFYGHIPLRTTINQFFGGMLALAGGFVVGREGPSVHLGAAGTSFLGQWMQLPSNSVRILAGCGIAAGISASFNTPFAAVIFVMEVVLREYRIHIFVPVMLAAACGSVLTRLVFGEVNELSFLTYSSLSPVYYFYLVLFGVALGALAALFNHQLMRMMRYFRPVNMVWRLLMAALFTGCVGMLLPDALGANFADIEDIFSQQPGAIMLGALLMGKLALAICAIGLGIPGGIIGPVMVIGMLAGALLVLPLEGWLALDVHTSSFALLGVAGMLTAVLHAPLAALSAVMELSYNPQIILPAMLVIVPAYVTSTQFLGNRSIFIRQLEFQNLPYAISPVRESLEKTGVLAVISQDYHLLHDATNTAVERYLAANPTHLVVLQHTFELGMHYQLVHYNVSLDHQSTPLLYHDMEGLNAQCTLHEVYEKLRSARAGAVYIYDEQSQQLLGIVTWEAIQAQLLQAKY